MNILPIPHVPITIRPATMADMPFLDGLQKQHNKGLGFFPRAQMEGYVQNGWVLVAADATTRQPLGYCASRDRYLKRDELGVIYQLCVTPGGQRKLIGASLIKAVFERSAYGCRLYCCWCAQDLAANYFWESLGFVPIAFRAGSTGKKRVHIFWQRRIDDEQSQIGNRQSAIPYWYPFQTNGGAIREDRIVFPIPPGVHWSEVKAVEVPRAGARELAVVSGSLPVAKTKRKGRRTTDDGPAANKVGILVGGRIKYVDRPGPGGAIVKAAAKPELTKREKRPKYDPKYLTAARELRDRYLEHVNGERVNDERFALPAPRGNYDVSRALRAASASSSAAASASSAIESEPQRRRALPSAA